jgi:hypothetical protein
MNAQGANAFVFFMEEYSERILTPPSNELHARSRASRSSENALLMLPSAVVSVRDLMGSAVLERRR